VQRVRQLRSLEPPMDWPAIDETLQADFAAERREAIAQVQREEAARPHARPQPTGASGMRTPPVLVA
jgi:hypothetical protein